MRVMLRMAVTSAFVLGGIKGAAMLWPVPDSFDIYDTLGNIAGNLDRRGLGGISGLLTSTADGFQQELADEIAKRVIMGALFGAAMSAVVLP